MSDLTYYTHPQSRGRIAHWMMEEIGEPYETVWMDFGAPMKSESYLAVNPMGKVPALRHGGMVVTEAPAICAYLADRFPGKGLAPAHGDALRAPYYRWLFFTAGPLEQAVTARALNWQVPEGRQGMVGFGCYDDTVRTLATALARGPYICGGQFTAADVVVGSALGWGMMFGTIDKQAVFSDYVARLQERPAAQRARQINEARLQSSKQ